MTPRTPSRARRRTAAAQVLVTGVLLPLLTGGLLAWSWSGRAEAVDQVPLAIVNEDTVVTGDQPMAAGRALTAALVHPDDGTPALGWRTTDAATAQAGLADGTYRAVLTIPEDFSAAVLSAGTDDPEQARLDLQTDPTSTDVATLAAQAVTTAAADTLGDQVTTAYLENVLAGVDTLGTSLGAAADGAGALADGAGRLADGTATLADGTARLTEATGTLADGTDQLTTGAGALADGLGTLASSATTLADGATGLATGTAGLVDGTAALADGATAAATGATSLTQGATATADGAATLADGLAQLDAQCPLASPSAAFCAQLATAAAASADLATGTQTVADGTATLGDSLTGLTDATARLSAAAVQVDAGADQLASGTGALATGAGGAADSARTLVDATATVAGGTHDVATGTQDLAEGAQQVADGADDLTGGAADLADGLAEGADAAPATTTAQQEQIASVVTRPVGVTTSPLAPVDGRLGAASAAAALWLGALATLLAGRRGLRPDDLDAPTATPRLLRAVLAPRLAVAALQGVVVTGAVAALGTDPDRALAVGALTLLTAAALTLLATGATLRGGRTGVLALAALTALQLAALGGLVPVETAPAPLRTLAALLPLGAYGDAATALSDGHPVDPGAVLVVVAWGLAGLALAGTGLHRRRTATLTPVPA